MNAIELLENKGNPRGAIPTETDHGASSLLGPERTTCLWLQNGRKSSWAHHLVADCRSVQAPSPSSSCRVLIPAAS